MATFTNIAKNIVSFTNTVKNVSTFANSVKSGILTFLLTDIQDYILVGSAEDEILITQQPTSWSNTNKN
jgi:hypothetical protein